MFIRKKCSKTAEQPKVSSFPPLRSSSCLINTPMCVCVCLLLPILTKLDGDHHDSTHVVIPALHHGKWCHFYLKTVWHVCVQSPAACSSRDVETRCRCVQKEGTPTSTSLCRSLLLCIKTSSADSKSRGSFNVEIFGSSSFCRSGQRGQSEQNRQQDEDRNGLCHSHCMLSNLQYPNTDVMHSTFSWLDYNCFFLFFFKWLLT